MNKNSGFTLVEVLIAVIVLSFGLLGLAGLQARGLNNNLSSYNRSQAAQLAYDMADRIRANSAQANKYLSSNMTPSAATCRTTSGSTCVDCLGSTRSCTAVQLAEKDLYDWNNALINTFPGGSGAVTGAGSTFNITVRWDDNRDGTTDANDPGFSFSFNL